MGYLFKKNLTKKKKTNKSLYKLCVIVVCNLCENHKPEGKKKGKSNKELGWLMLML